MTVVSAGASGAADEDELPAWATWGQGRRSSWMEMAGGLVCAVVLRGWWAVRGVVTARATAEDETSRTWRRSLVGGVGAGVAVAAGASAGAGWAAGSSERDGALLLRDEGMREGGCYRVGVESSGCRSAVPESEQSRVVCSCSECLAGDEQVPVKVTAESNLTPSRESKESHLEGAPLSRSLSHSAAHTLLGLTAPSYPPRMSSALETWVSDNLLVLLGASDSLTVQYFVTLAKSAPDPQALAATLAHNGLPPSPHATRFARDLFARVPRPARNRSDADTRRKAEREKQQLKGQKFTLVLDDDDADTGDSAAAPSSSSKRDKPRDRDRDRKATARRRPPPSASGAEGAWGSEDEDERAIKRRREDERTAASLSAARKHGGDDAPPQGDDEEGVRDEEEEDPAVRAERERLRDLAERDAFAARMREKDKDRTKRLVGERASAADSERARLAEEEDPQAEMRALRGRARQAYLGKREQQQLDLLRIEIADWERDFRGVRLTRREEDELRRKKELLRLAEERLAIDDGVEHYQMPDGAFVLSLRRETGS